MSSAPSRAALARALAIDLRVDVEPVDAAVGVARGHRDGRPAGAGRDVRHTAAGLEPSVDIGDGREPLLREQVAEHGPVGQLLRLDETRVHRPFDAFAGAVGGGDRGQHQAGRPDGPDHRRGGAQAVGIEEGLGVAGREREAADVGFGGRVIDLEDAGRGLLLQPFAGVPGVGAGRLRELGRGHRAVVRERLVEPELEAELRCEQVPRAERGLEQATGERIATGELVCGQGRGRHGHAGDLRVTGRRAAPMAGLLRRLGGWYPADVGAPTATGKVRPGRAVRRRRPAPASPRPARDTPARGSPA